MTSLEYLIKKNELVERVTGKILIPSDQLEDVPYSEEFKPSEDLNGSNCPYCVALAPCDTCEPCIMYKRGNECINPSSSYTIANNVWLELATDEDREELYQLGLDYERSNK